MPTDIFRSVGITGTDLGGAETMQIVGNTMTTTAALADNIGVGDAITWNDGADQLAFIHGRTSSTVYTVQNADGGAPTSASAGQAFGVFRSYTSLFNAAGAVENANINEPTENDVNPNLDFVSVDTVVRYACYADGTDTVRPIFGGEVTDATRFLQIFTPVDSSQVGVSQRHNGTLQAGTTAYRLEVADTGASTGTLELNTGFTEVDGLQCIKTSA